MTYHRPLVLLDVDGPLNPFAAKVKPAGFVEHKFRLDGWSRRKPLRIWLNPDHGLALLAATGTAADLTWATTWEHRANTMIGPALGLPNLPVIEFRGALTKFDAVARYAGERSLAWLDDDFDMNTTARDRFLAERAHLATALIRVDPHTGITDTHLAAVRDFLAQ